MAQMAQKFSFGPSHSFGARIEGSQTAVPWDFTNWDDWGPTGKASTGATIRTHNIDTLKDKSRIFYTKSIF